MTGLIVGLITTAAIIAFAEVFRKIDLKFFASLNLAVIPFIYIGFSIDPHSLMLTVPGAAFFLFFLPTGGTSGIICLSLRDRHSTESGMSCFPT